MSVIEVTLAVFHLSPSRLMFWLKLAAPLNMLLISVTLAVFQLPIGWLNAVASMNMLDMLVTASVSHLAFGATPLVLIA